MKRVLLEAVFVLVAGGLIAFAANHLSPSGLTISRNYFPGGTNSTIASPIIGSSDITNVTNGSPQVVSVAARAREHGFQILTRAETFERFRDPLLALNLIVFIDARNEARYAQGHIPGAYEFDHYRPEKHLAIILPLCLAAEQVVIYCGGGDCEDSLFAAMSLRDAGVDPGKLFIFAGGIEEWAANELPIETGPRGSGQLRNSTP